MKIEKIDYNTLYDNAEKIANALSYLIGFFRKNFDIELSEIKSFEDGLIDKAVKYGLHTECEEFDDQAFIECTNIEDLNPHILYEIPDSFREALKKSIDNFIKSNTIKDPANVFIVNSSQRYNFLIKMIQHQIIIRCQDIELIKKLKKQKTITEEVEFCFIKYINDNLEKIISNSIKFILCFENNTANRNMCQEILSPNYIGVDDHTYRLEKSVFRRTQTYINSFLENYLNTKKDDILNFDESKKAIITTLKYAKSYINDEYSQSSDKNREVEKIYLENLKALDDTNLSAFIDNSKKTNAFKIQLSKANMNFIIIHDNEYIYPFLLDLIVMRFNILFYYELHKKEIVNPIAMAKKLESSKYDYKDSLDHDNYQFQQLINLLDTVDEIYINKDLTFAIVKHYSEILNVDHGSILSILRQLNYPIPDKDRGICKILEDQKNKKLNLGYDYFRHYSSNINING